MKTLETMIGHPAAKFFIGDLYAEDNGTGDPDVCFVGGESASAFLSLLEQLGRQFFVSLFPHDGPYGTGLDWLYEPLCVFLREAGLRIDAVVILWEKPACFYSFSGDCDFWPSSKAEMTV